MAGCCGQSSCSCIIQAGDGVQIVGSGSSTDPYIVSSEFPDFSDLLSVQDTQTVNLTLWGSGNPDDPFLLRADATVRFRDITDVEGSPSVGQVPVWVASPSPGHVEWADAPVPPAGAVNTGDGLNGDGSFGDPLEVAVSGEWGVAPLDQYGPDSTVGLAIYVDTNGELRAQPVTGSTVAWDDVTGKPTIFPTNAANVADPLNLDVGFIRGKRIFTNHTDTTGSGAPTTGVSDGDLYFHRAP